MDKLVCSCLFELTNQPIEVKKMTRFKCQNFGVGGVMVEKINTQTIVSPASFAPRVKKVNQQDADEQQRRFEGQLEEENEKKNEKKRTKHAFEFTGIGDGRETGKVPAETGNEEDRNINNTQEKLIDILV